ncbi:aldo/keto reductase [Paenibacillus xerothermodurans]|uniref:Aldo/keto reductase n=1 Tax=Paenibacillus xerothermodurans TaxID=1977292 RepID=A0A2W1NV28_PAEXE|nr:aldo/keto reductase [Paenibacillus xerothermodurans]PZE19542.1 aldo/keto reductase [Paenibacillus xerothermodurans]
MDIRSLGKTGLKVTGLCLGTMTFGNQADKKASFEILDTAYEAGVNFIDTADVYPIGRQSHAVAGTTESIIGEWLQGKRDQVVLATKCFGAMGPGPNEKGLSRKHIIAAVEDSLRRLKTDYLDLYQAHQFNPDTPMDETLRAFDDLVQQGKVRYIGISNWRAWHVAKANGIADRKNYARIVSVQPRYNLLFRMIEDDLVPMALDEGIGIISYNPLAGGMLTGRYGKNARIEEGTRFALGNNAGAFYQERYWKEATFDAVERYRAWCEEHSLNPVTTAVRWVTQQPGITSAIIGASRPEQLDASLQAADMDALTEQQVAWLDGLWFSLPRRREFS